MTDVVISNIDLLDSYTISSTIIVGSDISPAIFDNMDDAHIIESFDRYSLQEAIMTRLNDPAIVVIQPVKEPDDLLAIYMALLMDISCTFILDDDVFGTKSDVLDKTAELIVKMNGSDDASKVRADLSTLFDDGFGQVIRYDNDTLIEL